MRILAIVFLFLLRIVQLPAQNASSVPIDKVGTGFRSLLDRPKVEFNPSFQSLPSDFARVEKGFINSESGEKVPMLIYKPLKSNTADSKSFPVVICLHGTGGNKEQMTKVFYRLVTKGIMAVAIDARYHGERIPGGAHGSTEYVDAITKAWKNTDPNNQKHPFFFDTVYDLWRLTDYLVTRPDVQADRIGMMGISMGGIETWLAASVDKRIKVAVPAIAVQSFKWSLENDKWQGRAKTIWAAHQLTARDVGDTSVNARNVETLWNKLVPGITGPYDCPSMIRLFAPRPLLILNNEKDMNCPLPGSQIAFAEATKAYQSYNALDKLKIHVTPNEPHRFTDEHLDLMIEWFVKWL
jgi:dienelactone hydrolase